MSPAIGSDGTLYVGGNAARVRGFFAAAPPPAITISPSSGKRGSSATVAGSGFGAMETVTVKWNCSTIHCASTVVLGTATTDSTGSFANLQVKIPRTARIGKTYPVGAIGKTSGLFASTTFKVTR